MVGRESRELYVPSTDLSHLGVDLIYFPAYIRRPSTLQINTFLDLKGRLGAAFSSAPTLSLLSSVAGVTARGCERRLTLRVVSARADRVRIDDGSEVSLQIDLELSKVID